MALFGLSSFRLYGIGSFLILIILLYLFHVLDLRINLTPSIPIGIYQHQTRSTQIYHKNLISFCLPKSIALTGKSRDYIGSGICPGNAVPLLKRVIALPGDMVRLTSNAIIVNGKHYFAPQQKMDSEHKNVMHWIKCGTYHVKNKVWVYGSHDPIYSWDSRYFGGIPVKNILGVYKPLWVIR